MPTMSKMPTRASSPAAVVWGIPWSWAAGMKWVPIRPLVDQPQIQKVPSRIQKTRLDRLSRRVWTARRAGEACRTAGPAALSSPGRSPSGRAPTSCGWSATTTRTSGTRRRAAAVTVSAAYRQPGPTASAATPGRKTSCPAAPAAEKTPVTRPRWLSANHRLATTAPSTSAIAPVPMPTASPQSSHSCQACGHHQRQAAAHRDEHERGGHHAADAEALHQRGREGCGQPVDHQVGGHGARRRRARPAELGLQRLEQRAGRGPEPGSGDQGSEHDRGHPPGAVDAGPAVSDRGHRRNITRALAGPTRISGQ